MIRYNYPLSGTTSPNPFDLGDMGSTMPLTINNTGAKPKKSVNSLLGEHSNLVNLDNLVTDSKNQGEKFNYFSYRIIFNDFLCLSDPECYAVSVIAKFSFEMIDKKCPKPPHFSFDIFIWD